MFLVSNMCAEKLLIPGDLVLKPMLPNKLEVSKEDKESISNFVKSGNSDIWSD